MNEFLSAFYLIHSIITEKSNHQIINYLILFTPFQLCWLFFHFYVSAFLRTLLESRLVKALAFKMH